MTAEAPNYESDHLQSALDILLEVSETLKKVPLQKIKGETTDWMQELDLLIENVEKSLLAAEEHNKESVDVLNLINHQKASTILQAYKLMNDKSSHLMSSLDRHVALLCKQAAKSNRSAGACLSPNRESLSDDAKQQLEKADKIFDVLRKVSDAREFIARCIAEI